MKQPFTVRKALKKEERDLKKEKPPEVYITGGQPVDKNGVFKNTEAAPTPTNDENEKLRNEFFTMIDIIRSSDDLMKKDGGSGAK